MAVVLLPLSVLVCIAGASLLIGAGFDRALAIGAVAYGVAALVLAEIRTRDAPTKSIVIVGIDDVAFMTNVVEGLREELMGSVPFELKILSPGALEKTPSAWQTRQIESAAAASADALVIVPASDDSGLWNALARHIRRGVTVVAVDRHPRRALFLDAGLQPPPYVASDFVMGGRLVGEIIADRLAADPHSRALVALGPGESGPGVARSSQVLYELARRGMSGRMQAAELGSWDVAEAVTHLAGPLESLLARRLARVVVFCGDDRIAVALQRECAPRRAWAGRVELVGYDGARAVDGRLIALEHDLVIATVDTQPRAQGGVVGQILREAYHREASQDTDQRLVDPVLVRPGGV